MCTTFNDDPTKASRPFDKDRAGFVMGEGAGVVLLESLSSAKSRGARIYCELAGYGASCDAHHITTPAPGGRGLADAMERAIEGSGVEKEEVGYVNAHGTSTAYNDRFETMAIRSVFGEHADKGREGGMVVSSTKGVTGHTLGAAGGIEAIVASLAIYNDKVSAPVRSVRPFRSSCLFFLSNPNFCSFCLLLSPSFSFCLLLSPFVSFCLFLFVFSPRRLQLTCTNSSSPLPSPSSSSLSHLSQVPPTINLDEPSDDCDLDYVPNTAREMKVEAAMSTNLGFGGHNAALLFKKYRKEE